jgi:hypothetical protein
MRNSPLSTLRSAAWGFPLLIILFSLFAISPALGSGYWWGAHDARHAVYFLFEFNQAIQDGIWWPRWAPDYAFGYGYPFFNIYGPLSSYIGEFFYLAGMDLVSAVKTTFALSIVASGLTMYAFVRRIWGENAGLVAGVAYMYLPYHLADVYVRAALAESWALVWFPLLFWGFYECVVNPRPRAIALTAVAYALLFISHNGLSVPFTFLLMAWIAFWLIADRLPNAKFWGIRWRGILGAGGAAVLGIVLGGIFIFPWLVEYQYVNTDQWLKGYFAFPDHFIEFWQLFSPTWGFGISVPGPNDNFPLQLGIVPVLFAVGAWVIQAQNGTQRRSRLFLTLALIGIICLMLPISQPLWFSPIGDLVLKPMQFPWRFLVLAGFVLAALAGAVAHTAPRWLAVLLAMVVIVGSYDYVRAEIIEPAEGPVSFAGLMRFQQSAGEMTGQSTWVALEDIPTWSPLADVWVNGGEVTSRFSYDEGIQAGNAVKTSYYEITEVKLDLPRTIRWMITYYPGWRVYRLALDSDLVLEELPIVRQEGTAHITVNAPAGHYRYMVRFEDTPIRTFGKISTGVGAIIVLLLLILPSAQRIFAMRWGQRI